MSKRELWFGVAVFAVVVIAIGFRFYDIQRFPPGVSQDFAHGGGQVVDFFQGRLEVQLPSEFGVSAWHWAAISAGLGVLMVLLIYFATHVFFGRLAGVLAAVFMASSHWHVTVSRGGAWTGFVPLLDSGVDGLVNQLSSLFVSEMVVDWRLAVVGYPLLNPLVQFLFLAGLMWAVWGTTRRLSMVYPLLLLLVVLVPVVPVFVLAGAAAAVMVHWLQKRVGSQNGLSVVYGIVAGVMILGALYDGSLYFLMARNDSQARDAFAPPVEEAVEAIPEVEAPAGEEAFDLDA